MNLQNTILLIVVIIAIIAMAVYLVHNQQTKVIEWLKFAVTEAEKLLGGGTGQLKLRKVYDWFVEKFPFLAAIIPFKVFSAWVDVALEQMRCWLNNNPSVESYILSEIFKEISPK